MAKTPKTNTIHTKPTPPLYTIRRLEAAQSLHITNNRVLHAERVMAVWGTRPVIYLSDGAPDMVDAVLFDKPAVLELTAESKYLTAPPNGSLFVSSTFARHHGLGGVLLPIWDGVRGVPFHLVREMNGRMLLGWSVIRAAKRAAIDKYLDGLKQCDQGGPNKLEIVSLNDPALAFQGQLGAMRDLVPLQTFSHLQLELPANAPTQSAAWLVEFRFV